MTARRVRAATAVILLLSGGMAAHAASGGPMPRSKPSPPDFIIPLEGATTDIAANRVLYSASAENPAVEPMAPLHPGTKPLVLHPTSNGGQDPVAVPYTVTEAAAPHADPTRAPVISLSNQKTDLHELVLRPDVTTAINFQGSERIRTVLMGRAEEFFVDTPKSRQTISVRPKTARSKSNMTVVTNRDIYHFDLRSVSQSSGAMPVYGVVIEDSEATKRANRNSLADVENLNFSYTFKGSDDLRPLRLFDDGKHTYFQFPDHTAIPAIFSVGPGGIESIVNQHVKGNYLVVESLGRQFTLRRGRTHTCIYNKAYPSPHYDDGAPQPEGAS